MRARRCAPWLLAALCLGAPRPGAASERAYRLGGGPWSLEQFGTDVAVLRSLPSGPAADDVGLLLGCAGGERRLRLTFPASVGPAAAKDGGTVLLAAAGPDRPHVAVVTRFRMAGAKTWTASSAAPGAGNPVSRLAMLLADAPRALDVLVSWGGGPVVLTRLDVFRLALQGRAPARGLVTQFLAACGRAGVPQAD